MARLFEQDNNGRLTEIEDTDEARLGRRISHTNLSVDILWTAEQETEREAEEQARRDLHELQVQEQTQRDEVRGAAVAKLEKLGITAEELKAILAGT